MLILERTILGQTFARTPLFPHVHIGCHFRGVLDRPRLILNRCNRKMSGGRLGTLYQALGPQGGQIGPISGDHCRETSYDRYITRGARRPIIIIWSTSLVPF